MGRGGQAHVFLGRIVELNQLIAIKQFDVLDNQESKIVEDVRKEMQLVRNLNHPNIVKFYTVHTCNLTNQGIQYNILMEYMDGGSLEKWI